MKCDQMYSMKRYQIIAFRFEGSGRHSMCGLFLIIAWAAFFLSSCSKKDECPADEILGRLSLNDQSKVFLPYHTIRFIEFIDSTGKDTATLYGPNGLVVDSSNTIVENICLVDEDRADRYYRSEHFTINYFDLDTSRKFRIIGNLSVVEDVLSPASTPLDPVLYDELKLTVHRANPSVSGGVATLEFVASDRGNSSRFSDSLKLLQNRYALVPQVKINDSTYTNVFEYRNGDSLYFYFKPLVGIVAFRSLDNRWWNLSRVF